MSLPHLSPPPQQRPGKSKPKSKLIKTALGLSAVAVLMLASCGTGAALTSDVRVVEKEVIKEVPVPGPTVEVEKEVPGPEVIKEVPGPVEIKEVEVAPEACALALSYADIGFGLAADSLQAVFDQDVAELERLTDEINTLQPMYLAAKAECAEASK